MQQVFKAKLTPRGPGGAWTFLTIPFDVATVFGSKARVPVAGTINGFPFRTSIMPEGDGTHAMMVGRAMRAGARAAPGDTVDVVMSIDRAERTVAIPDELQTSLATDPDAAAWFARLAPSHRQEYAEWVGGAKKAETRASRAGKAIAMIKSRQHVK